MNRSTITNLLIVLGVLTAALGGYYLFNAVGISFSLTSTRSDSEFQSMQNRTQVFIERGRILDQVVFDMSMFESDSFNNLVEFDTTPIVEQPIGRENPFSEPEPAVMGEPVSSVPAPTTPAEPSLDEDQENTTASTEEDAS